MTELTYLELDRYCWFGTNIIPTLNTEIEVVITPLEPVQTYWDCYIGAQNSDDNPGTFQIRRYDRQTSWAVRVMNVERSPFSFQTGTTYTLKLNRTGFYVDGDLVSSIGAIQDNAISYDIYIGATHNNQGAFRPSKARFGHIYIRGNNGVTLGHFIPVDNNGTYGFYDAISQTFFTNLGSGTVVPGPAAWIPFTPDSFEFDQTGGTGTLTLYAPTGDTFNYYLDVPATLNNWLTVDSTSGRIQEGETLDITLTTTRNYDSARTATIEVWDAELENNLGSVSVSQDAYFLPDVYYPSKVLFNDNQLLKEYLNNANVKRIFYNGNEIFRRVSFMPSLTLETDELTFKKTGGTDTVGITANTTYTVSTSASWFTIATAATGISVTAADYSTGTTERTGTISVVCNNGDFSVSSSITVTQKVQSYTDVSYIIMENPGWSASYCITTPIVMANDYKVRLKYKATGNGTDRLVGFTWEDTDIYGQGISDNADFRPFTYNNGSYDFQSARRSNLNFLNSGTEYDLTFGNYYVYDHINETYLYNGNAQNLTTEAYIRVDIGNYIKELIVYDGNDNVIFDGKAGYDEDNHIGLYDEVSDQMYYNPNVPMTYEA